MSKRHVVVVHVSEPAREQRQSEATTSEDGRVELINLEEGKTYYVRVDWTVKPGTRESARAKRGGYLTWRGRQEIELDSDLVQREGE